MLVTNDDKEILSYNSLLSFSPCFLKPGDPTSPADIRKDSFPASHATLGNRPGPLPSSAHTDHVHASKWRTPRRRSSVPKDLPLSRIENGSLEALLRNNPDPYHHARDGRKVILGPMPVKAFLEDFLPPAPDESPMPRSSAAFHGVPSNPRNERDIYIPLAEAINNDRRCPSVNFCITADRRACARRRVPRPALCGYANNDIRSVMKESDSNLIQEDIRTRYESNLGLTEIFVVVRKDHDPFCDHHVHKQCESGSCHEGFFCFENRKYVKQSDFDAGKQEKRNLGQSVHHAADACSRQHRVFYFSILVIGTRARFFRWDRAGGIVTRAFDYKDHPELLCKFLWRFHHANPVQRGFDPTVTIASKAEEDLFVKHVKKHISFQLGVDEKDTKELEEELEQHYERGRVTRMEVHDKRVRSAPRVFLVSVPLAYPKSVVGRSTRAYWAVEVITPNKGKVCFLKDSWRIDDGDMPQEGAIYDELDDGKVEFVCNLECSGDVPAFQSMDQRDGGKNIDFRDRPFASQMALDEYTLTEQRTRTHDYIDAPWVCKCLRESLRLRVLKHTHYRVVLKQAGYPLRTFRGSRELFGATHDALRAINSARTHCKRLHRDVSLDNIILYRFETSQLRRGLLIDWEFSVLVDEYGKAIDDTQIGTWPFMSRRALNWSDGFRHTKEDDMESLLYVVMYACVRWLPHNSKSQLGRWIYDFFDEVSVGNRGQFAGGGRKELEQICSGSKFLEKFRFDNPYIRMWFRAAYQYLETDHEIPKQKGVAHLWTMDNFRDVFRNVCLGLFTTEDTNNDRVENEMGDYLAAVDGACHGTDTSLRAAAKTFRANLDSFNTGVDQVEDEIFEYISEYGSDEWHGSERRDSKRRRLDSEQWQDEAINATAHGRQGTRCDHEIPSIPAIGDSELFFGLSRKAEKFTISGENELTTCEAVSMTRNAMKPLRRSSLYARAFNSMTVACTIVSPGRPVINLIIWYELLRVQ
ncbi:hypothetical protein ACEPAI_9685 [Sanghuangporus weigelae]